MTPVKNFRPGRNQHPLVVTAWVSGIAAGLSYGLPADFAATAIGLWFLGVTYLLTLRKSSDAAAARWGLSLGGLLDTQPLSARQLLGSAGRALALAAALCLLTFPFFWAGFLLWYGVEGPLQLRLWRGFADEALGQLLVIALPEEAFFRGYLQTALDERWPPRRRVLGAPVGWGLLVASVVFALGHLATAPDPGRLAVFFPSLVFGWLRARTGGIGAGTAYHAACNLFASFLGRSYGLLP